MSAENRFEYGDFRINLIKSSSGLKELILPIGSIASFSLYENVNSPGLTGRIVFAAVDVLGNRGVELYGGEELVGSIRVPDFPESEIRISFRIRSMQVVKESGRAAYKVELVSFDTLKNETIRLSNRFEGNIATSAEKIFKSLGSKKTIATESTSNKYSFIGNSKRPFDLLTMLTSKAVSSGEKKSPGYFFFETQDQYVFKSINTLLKGDGDSVVYTQTEAAKENTPNNRFRILTSYVDKNNDILNSLRMGMYSNSTFFYNMYTNEAKRVDYKLEQKYNKEIETSAQKLTEKYPTLPGNIQEFPSRYYVRSLDVGVLDKTGKLSKDTMYPDLPKYQAEAVVRYNLLFSQVLKITVPCNPSLRAGQVIECRIPETASQMKDKSYQSQNSGRYMISALHHAFSGRECYTSLELVRDSYEVKTQVV
jgi:hypothetical protein